MIKKNEPEQLFTLLFSFLTKPAGLESDNPNPVGGSHPAVELFVHDRLRSFAAYKQVQLQEIQSHVFI